MPDWIHHKHAGFVLAAYTVAAVILLGMLAQAWLARRQARFAARALPR